MNKVVGKRPGRRSGVTLIVVLVCLTVASAILLGSVKTSLQIRRQTRRELQMYQAICLADAGLQTAIQKIASDVDYGGEKIELVRGAGKFSIAKLEISIEQNEKNELVVSATSRVGSDSNDLVAKTKSKTIQNKSTDQ